MLSIFLTAAVTYTALESAYWYFRWWLQLRNEPLPIVKSLLFAVFTAQIVILFGYGYHIATEFGNFEDPIWLASILMARMLYMIPIWRQKIRAASFPMYLLRATAFATLATVIGNYVI